MVQGILQLMVFGSALILGSGGDALADKKNSRLGFIMQASEIGILVMSPFIINPAYTSVWDILAYGASYLCLRAATFDPLYNIFYGHPINYTGTVKWWDRQMAKVPPFGRWTGRIVALAAGIGLSIIGIL